MYVHQSVSLVGHSGWGVESTVSCWVYWKQDYLSVFYTTHLSYKYKDQLVLVLVFGLTIHV